MAGTFQAVVSFTFPYEADVARIPIELEGIRTRLADDAAVGWFWYLSNALGGVKVLVETQCAAGALEILHRSNPAMDAHRDESHPDMASEERCSREEPASEAPICPKCREEIPEGWEVCWACGAAIDRPEDREQSAPRASDSSERQEPADLAAARASSPGARVAQVWPCSRCGARVPNDFAVCWSCGTTIEGEVDPDFEAADAPIVEHDLDRSTPLWLPAACIVCPPLLVYEVLLRASPERPPVPVKRGLPYAVVDRRLIRACLLAVLGIGFFPPLVFASLWLLPRVTWGKGAQRVRTRTCLLIATVLSLLHGVPLVLLLVYVLRFLV